MTSPLSFCVPCDNRLQSIRCLLGCLLCNMPESAWSWIQRWGIFSVLRSSFCIPCTTQALVFWSCHQVNGRQHLLSYYQVNIQRRIPELTGSETACWHWADVLYSKQMCLVLNLLLHAVITRKKGTFQASIDLINVMLYLTNRIPSHKQSCFIRNPKVTHSVHVSLKYQLTLDPEPCTPCWSLIAVLHC